MRDHLVQQGHDPKLGGGGGGGGGNLTKGFLAEKINYLFMSTYLCLFHLPSKFGWPDHQQHEVCVCPYLSILVQRSLPPGKLQNHI